MKSGLHLLLGLAVLSGCSAPHFPRFYENRHADPQPEVRLAPAAPCEGDDVVMTGSRVPADTTIEVWQTPAAAGGFKAGLYHPGAMLGRKLGEVKTSAGGTFTFSFKMSAPASTQRHWLWLVYPPGNVIAPAVASWNCPPPEGPSSEQPPAQ